MPFEYSQLAVNTAPDSENRMHDDAIAARYGFRGGLVPGVDVFGYLCQAFEANQGVTWRSQGWGELRLIRPFYHGDHVIVKGEESIGAWALSAEGEDGGVRATLRLGLRNLAALPNDVPAAALPATSAARPPASTDSLEPGTILGSIVKTLKDATPREMLEGANQILMANYVLEPWIHTASKLQWFAAPSPGQEVEIRAVILDRFERKGHSMVRFLASYVPVGSESAAVLLQVDHTAIWHLNPA